jgi:hypothetical protein
MLTANEGPTKVDENSVSDSLDQAQTLTGQLAVFLFHYQMLMRTRSRSDCDLYWDCSNYLCGDDGQCVEISVYVNTVCGGPWKQNTISIDIRFINVVQNCSLKLHSECILRVSIDCEFLLDFRS